MSDESVVQRQVAFARRGALVAVVVGGVGVVAGIIMVALGYHSCAETDTQCRNETLDLTAWGAGAISIGLVFLVIAFYFRARAYRVEFQPKTPEAQRQSRKSTLLGIAAGLIFVLVVMGRDIAAIFR
ncbi:hypothetical protein BH09ACT10_BH09ACT10_30320 [soil metagenome]